MATVVWALNHPPSFTETESSSLESPDSKQIEKPTNEKVTVIAVEQLPLGEPPGKSKQAFWFSKSQHIDLDAIVT